MSIGVPGCGATGLPGVGLWHLLFVLRKFHLGLGFSGVHLCCLKQKKAAKKIWIGSLVGAEAPGLEQKALGGGTRQSLLADSLLGRYEPLQVNYAVVSAVCQE
jgi:hypothetical protein